MTSTLHSNRHTAVYLNMSAAWHWQS